MARLGGFGDLSRRTREISEEIRKGVDNKLRAAALLADQSLVLTTPVDTGRARGNWIPSIGEPSTDILPEPASPEAGAQEALNKGQDTASNWGAGKGAFYVTNNLPYIEPLDNGSSTQAPAGMTANAKQVAIEVFRSTPIFDR